MRDILNGPSTGVRGFDERQVAARGRVGTTSFFALLVLVLVDGWINDTFGVWGNGLDQAMTLFFVGLTIFTVQAVWVGAYFRSEVARRRFLVLFTVVLVIDLAVIAVALVQHSLDLWSAGRAGPDFLSALPPGFFALVLVASVLRSLRDRRADVADDADRW